MSTLASPRICLDTLLASPPCFLASLLCPSLVSTRPCAQTFSALRHSCSLYFSPSRCKRRIRERFERTQRDVPDQYLRMAFTALTKSVPVCSGPSFIPTVRLRALAPGFCVAIAQPSRVTDLIRLCGQLGLIQCLAACTHTCLRNHWQVYVRSQAELAEAVLIFDNGCVDGGVGPRIVQGDRFWVACP